MLQTRLLQGRLTARCFSSAALVREQQYDYTKISNIIKSPSPATKLIDVREPHEYEAGHIPTSINIPLSTFERTLSLPAHEFRQTVGAEKPTVEEEVVFYCKAGVRSTTASQIAERKGYKAVGNYKGSWSDYSSRTTTTTTTTKASPSPSSDATSANAKRLFCTTARQGAASKRAPNPNVKDGAGEGAPGGIDLKKMNQREEKRAEGDKEREKKDGKLVGAKDEESESVKSGAELSGHKKFE